MLSKFNNSILNLTTNINNCYISILKVDNLIIKNTKSTYNIDYKNNKLNKNSENIQIFPDEILRIIIDIFVNNALSNIEYKEITKIKTLNKFIYYFLCGSKLNKLNGSIKYFIPNEKILNKINFTLTNYKEIFLHILKDKKIYINGLGLFVNNEKINIYINIDGIDEENCISYPELEYIQENFSYTQSKYYTKVKITPLLNCFFIYQITVKEYLETIKLHKTNLDYCYINDKDKLIKSFKYINQLYCDDIWINKLNSPDLILKYYNKYNEKIKLKNKKEIYIYLKNWYNKELKLTFEIILVFLEKMKNKEVIIKEDKYLNFILSIKDRKFIILNNRLTNNVELFRIRTKTGIPLSSFVLQFKRNRWTLIELLTIRGLEKNEFNIFFNIYQKRYTQFIIKYYHS